MADATDKVRIWAAENPVTANAIGLTSALAAASRWKRARDKLLLEQERDEDIIATLLSAAKSASALLASLDEDYAEVESKLYDAIKKADPHGT